MAGRDAHSDRRVGREEATSPWRRPRRNANHVPLDLGLDARWLGALDAFGMRASDGSTGEGWAGVVNTCRSADAEIVSSPAYGTRRRDCAFRPSSILAGTSRADPFPDRRRRTITPRDRSRTIRTATDRGTYDPSAIEAGVLGVTSVEVRGDKAARSLFAAAAARLPERFDGYASWVTPRFEVRAPAPVAAGLDGEAVTLDVPLLFRTRPRALRIRLPLHAIGASPAARSLKPRDAAREVFRVAMGRPVRPLEVTTT